MPPWRQGRTLTANYRKTSQVYLPNVRHVAVPQPMDPIAHGLMNATHDAHGKAGGGTDGVGDVVDQIVANLAPSTNPCLVSAGIGSAASRALVFIINIIEPISDWGSISAIICCTIVSTADRSANHCRRRCSSSSLQEPSRKMGNRKLRKQTNCADLGERGRRGTKATRFTAVPGGGFLIARCPGRGFHRCKPHVPIITVLAMTKTAKRAAQQAKQAGRPAEPDDVDLIQFFLVALRQKTSSCSFEMKIKAISAVPLHDRHTSRNGNSGPYGRGAWKTDAGLDGLLHPFRRSASCGKTVVCCFAARLFTTGPVGGSERFLLWRRGPWGRKVPPGGRWWPAEDGSPACEFCHCGAGPGDRATRETASSRGLRIAPSPGPGSDGEAFTAVAQRGRAAVAAQRDGGGRVHEPPHVAALRPRSRPAPARCGDRASPRPARTSRAWLRIGRRQVGDGYRPLAARQRNGGSASRPSVPGPDRPPGSITSVLCPSARSR